MPKRRPVVLPDWEQLEDGGSDRWLWVRRIDEAGPVYQAVRIDHVDDRPPILLGDLLEVNLSEVDLGAVGRSCDLPDDAPEIQKVWACIGYGAYAPLHSLQDVPDREDRLARELRRLADQHLKRPQLREQALNRIVNAMGQTAREFARPGLPRAEGKVEIERLLQSAHNDRIPWVFGYMATPGSPDPPGNLAQAYKDGREYRRLVNMRVVGPPPFIKGQTENPTTFIVQMKG